MNNHSHDGGVHLSTVEKDMQAFDELPPAVREAYRNAPTCLSAEYAVGLPEDVFLAEYAEDFHGFTPLQPRPRRTRSFR
jgi:hypothetical protein